MARTDEFDELCSASSYGCQLSTDHLCMIPRLYEGCTAHDSFRCGVVEARALHFFIEPQALSRRANLPSSQGCGPKIFKLRTNQHQDQVFIQGNSMRRPSPQGRSRVGVHTFSNFISSLVLLRRAICPMLHKVPLSISHSGSVVCYYLNHKNSWHTTKSSDIPAWCPHRISPSELEAPALGSSPRFRPCISTMHLRAGLQCAETGM